MTAVPSSSVLRWRLSRPRRSSTETSSFGLAPPMASSVITELIHPRILRSEKQNLTSWAPALATSGTLRRARLDILSTAVSRPFASFALSDVLKQRSWLHTVGTARARHQTPVQFCPGAGKQSMPIVTKGKSRSDHRASFVRKHSSARCRSRTPACAGWLLTRSSKAIDRRRVITK